MIRRFNEHIKDSSSYIQLHFDSQGNSADWRCEKRQNISPQIRDVLNRNGYNFTKDTLFGKDALEYIFKRKYKYDVTITISQYEDEYFFVSFYYPDRSQNIAFLNRLNYKCDQVEGILKLLKDKIGND